MMKTSYTFSSVKVTLFIIGIDSFFPQEQLLQYYESSKFEYVPCFF